MSRATECGTKRPHSVRAAAERHRQGRITSGANPDTIKVYLCRWCDCWHVGTPGLGTNGRSSPQRRRGKR